MEWRETAIEVRTSLTCPVTLSVSTAFSGVALFYEWLPRFSGIKCSTPKNIIYKSSQESGEPSDSALNFKYLMYSLIAS